MSRVVKCVSGVVLCVKSSPLCASGGTVCVRVIKIQYIIWFLRNQLLSNSTLGVSLICYYDYRYLVV